MKIKPIAAALLTLGTLSSASGSMAGETEDRIAELELSLIHISEPTRRRDSSRMPSSA